MVTDNKQYETHSFKSFLQKYHVIIPMVQRDYAQGRNTEDVVRVRNRFLEAIRLYLVQPECNGAIMKLDFVYGEKEEIWSRKESNRLESIIVTPLDGQQRLTTLYLLHWFASQRDGVDVEEKEFLKHFTYGIRPSSRDFCKHLLEHKTDWSKSFKFQLSDQNWFMGEWNNDPTIIGMMVMLDAIKDKFSDIPDLWNKLTVESRIVFYFLPLSENGISDELYIKMNSRGKKLTMFEHFKAEYEALFERDSEEARVINHKFDVEWADTFFPYRNTDDIIDDEFMRYFFYVSHILCYKQSIKKSNDEFELIRLLYKDSANSLENRKYLEDALDCWHNVMKQYGSIDSFFNMYLTNSTYEKNKVATFKNWPEYQGVQNFFRACIDFYQVNSNFSYGDYLFLYGIITYLINKSQIDEIDFIKRLRILRNLIWNSSSGEIRGDADYMHDLISEVETLMLSGVINRGLRHGFNGLQEEEEQEKQFLIDKIDLEALHKYEDHPLIYGYASGLGYDNLYLVDTFYSLFSQKPDYLTIHQAMISIDDYMQEDSIRYYMANANRSTWSQLLHKSRNRKCFEEKTMPVLRSLLNRLKDGETLHGIISTYIRQKESENNYEWRYYFAKYPEMLRGADGEFAWNKSNKYICFTLNRHQFNGQHWNPYLNVIFQRLSSELQETYGEKVIDLGNYGDNLRILKPSSSLSATGTGFCYFYQESEELWDVHQEEKVDKEDRIEFAIKKIRYLVQKYYNKECNN